MKHESQKTPAKTPENSRSNLDAISAYAVQCSKCFKWRLVETVEEYEDIRQNFIEDPWFCSKNSDISCDDPADLEYDNTRTWVVDKPNIPKTPDGFQRGLSMRKDYSKMDTFYVAPNGKKVRAPAEVEKLLDANPEYKAAGVAVSDFNFSTPKIMEDTVPTNIASTGSNKKLKISKVENDDD